MPRLIWVFAECTDHFVGFVMRRLNYLYMTSFVLTGMLIKFWKGDPLDPLNLDQSFSQQYFITISDILLMVQWRNPHCRQKTQHLSSENSTLSSGNSTFVIRKRIIYHQKTQHLSSESSSFASRKHICHQKIWLFMFIDCVIDGRQLRNGQTYMPDSCTECVCRDGHVYCEPTYCPMVRCRNPITPPGECCPRCDNGIIIWFIKIMILFLSIWK